MIPYWYFLVGFLPIIVLMIPNNRKIRIITGGFMLLVLFWLWSGISKLQAVERDFIYWTLKDLAERSEKGQNEAVCTAIRIYVQKNRKEPFSGFDFRHSIESQIGDEKTKSEQSATGNGATTVPKP